MGHFPWLCWITRGYIWVNFIMTSRRDRSLGIMVKIKGNHPQMAQQFRWVNYCNLPRYNIYIYILSGLVVTGTMEFYEFPFSGEFHHPNWRTHIFQRGWNHQPDIYIYIYNMLTWKSWNVAPRRDYFFPGQTLIQHQPNGPKKECTKT